MEYPSVTITKTENGWILKYTKKEHTRGMLHSDIVDCTRVCLEWRYVEDFLKEYLMLDEDTILRELAKGEYNRIR